MTSVIELARQAGCAPEDGQSGFWVAQKEDLERFAKLVRNAALDEAAQKCRAFADASWYAHRIGAQDCAAAIESLKEPTP